ncbi:unnamed protein product [Linum trigynum]|uniref:Uncharacterized protein n=1 Tax=Linum trigynum TaxID=586398 RepID=A0AAV2GIZ5_9ROSI
MRDFTIRNFKNSQSWVLEIADHHQLFLNLSFFFYLFQNLPSIRLFFLLLWPTLLLQSLHPQPPTHSILSSIQISPTTTTSINLLRCPMPLTPSHRHYGRDRRAPKDDKQASAPLVDLLIDGPAVNIPTSVLICCLNVPG